MLVLGSLSVFAPYLTKTKRQGLLTYGALASRYVREFDKKWLQGGGRRRVKSSLAAVTYNTGSPDLIVSTLI
jgi:hypothetical protein